MHEGEGTGKVGAESAPEPAPVDATVPLAAAATFEERVVSTVPKVDWTRSPSEITLPMASRATRPTSMPYSTRAAPSWLRERRGTYR